MTAGERLRECRRVRLLSQQELAEACNVGQRAISHLETGESRGRMATWDALAEALGVSACFLLFGVEVPAETARPSC